MFHFNCGHCLHPIFLISVLSLISFHIILFTIIFHKSYKLTLTQPLTFKEDIYMQAFDDPDLTCYALSGQGF